MLKLQHHHPEDVNQCRYAVSSVKVTRAFSGDEEINEIISFQSMAPPNCHQSWADDWWGHS